MVEAALDAAKNADHGGHQRCCAEGAPLLIRRGADLPLLLIFAGVIGGLIAFGIMGLFIGPVVLAVAYTLLADWVAESAPSDEPAPPPTCAERTGG